MQKINLDHQAHHQVSRVRINKVNRFLKSSARSSTPIGWALVTRRNKNSDLIQIIKVKAVNLMISRKGISSLRTGLRAWMDIWGSNWKSLMAVMLDLDWQKTLMFPWMMQTKLITMSLMWCLVDWVSVSNKTSFPLQKRSPNSSKSKRTLEDTRPWMKRGINVEQYTGITTWILIKRDLRLSIFWRKWFLQMKFSWLRQSQITNLPNRT